MWEKKKSPREGGGGGGGGVEEPPEEPEGEPEALTKIEEKLKGLKALLKESVEAHRADATLFREIEDPGKKLKPLLNELKKYCSRDENDLKQLIEILTYEVPKEKDETYEQLRDLLKATFAYQLAQMVQDPKYAALVSEQDDVAVETEFAALNTWFLFANKTSCFVRVLTAREVPSKKNVWGPLALLRLVAMTTNQTLNEVSSSPRQYIKQVVNIGRGDDSRAENPIRRLASKNPARTYARAENPIRRLADVPSSTLRANHSPMLRAHRRHASNRDDESSVF